jgi:hypothetical protein
MKRFRRIALLFVTVCIAVAGASSAAYAWGPAQNWEAGTCNNEACTYESVEKNESESFNQAAGHPPWGITSFEIPHPGGEPEETLKRIRVDVPPGLAADPQTLPTCTRAQFNAGLCSPLTKAGLVQLEAFVGAPVNKTLSLSGNVYSLEQEPEHEGKPGLPLLFGIEVKGVEVPLVGLVENTRLFLEGHVSYAKEPALEARGVASGDFHEWFEINNIPNKVGVKTGPLTVAEADLKTVKSKLLFNGRAGHGNFLTVPSECGAPGKSTSFIELEDKAGAITKGPEPTVPPFGVKGCKAVPFSPNTQVLPQTSGYDQPDGATTNVIVPQNEGENEINTADIVSGHALFPEGLTLNPSAAHGLEACTPALVHFESKAPAACPAGSRLGSVNIETDLPKGSLAGSVYLGAPKGVPITGPPYTVYIVAESVYDVKVKVEATVTPDPNTGRLKVDVVNSAAHPFNLPQLPFSSATLTLNPGPRAPLANPLSCAAVQTESNFVAYSGEGVVKEANPHFGFGVTGCPNPVPFALVESTSLSSNKGGAFTNFTFNLSRNDGNQNISSVQTVLPPGLVGLIPSVKLCPEPAASTGSCPSTSQIGTATAAAGVGSEPFGFSGPVYLTGPTNGAPYGLSIPIEAAAGPFDLGRVLTRVAIGVDPHTARVIATATLPRIVGGVPLHLRSLSVAVNKSNFLMNPTNCGPLATDAFVAAIQGASAHTTSPFGVTACTSLPFKPAFAASSPTAPSRANGASLVVSFTQPAHQANIKSVVASLPMQLPSRLTTLHNACLAAVFAGGNNFRSCPAGSKVGSVTVKTPALPEPLTGPAYLVSHGGAAFPDLDLILEGDHGVKVVLEGNTNIKNGITTSTFASVPDVPVSSFELKLPSGPNSALGSFGSLCAKPLFMPTTITAQSGAVLKQNLHLSIGSCKIKLRSHKVKKHKLILRVQVFTAGRLSVKSPGLHTTFRKVGGPGIVTLKVPVSIKGARTLASGHQLKIKVRVGFNPRHKDEFHSAAFAKVTFKH